MWFTIAYHGIFFGWALLVQKDSPLASHQLFKLSSSAKCRASPALIGLDEMEY